MKYFSYILQLDIVGLADMFKAETQATKSQASATTSDFKAKINLLPENVMIKNVMRGITRE